MKKFNIIFIAFILVFLIGLVVGWYATREKSTRTVSSQMILTALHDRGFLVTQTYIFNEPVEIKDEDQSFWEKLLWGQVIKAHGVVEVNMGVDLSKITEGDVVVSGEGVQVYIPQAEIFNSRLVGEVTVENKQGILKRLFENDDGYNQAMAELTKLGEQAASDAQMIKVANDRARDEIGRLVGYIAPEKKIEIIVRGGAVDNT